MGDIPSHLNVSELATLRNRASEKLNFLREMAIPPYLCHGLTKLIISGKVDIKKLP